MTGHYTASAAVVLGWLCWWPVTGQMSYFAAHLLIRFSL